MENNFWFEKNFEKKFKGKKILGLENIFEQNCESKNLICKKKVKKNLGPTEIGVRIFFGSNKISGLKFWVWKSLSKNILVHKNYDPKRIGSKKFNQNWTSNIRDIACLDKFHQDICCLDKCHHNSWHLLNMVPRSYL